MELAPLVAAIADAERRQTYWWTKMLELEGIIGTERRRYISGALAKDSWIATAHACSDSWIEACRDWKLAKDEAAGYARQMERLVMA